MEKGLKKRRDTKWARILRHNCNLLFIRISSVHNPKIKLCTRLFKNKKYKIWIRILCARFVVTLNECTHIKVDMFS